MKFIPVFLVILFLALSAFAQADEINIIPKPQSIGRGSGSFKISKKTKILAITDAGRKFAEILNGSLQRNYGFKLQTTIKPGAKNVIEFAVHILFDTQGETPGGYVLNTSPDLIRISGGELGVFYGLQTLIQLMPVSSTNEINIPAVEIKDWPRFGYRGMHLDVARHFMPVDFVKKYIDLMSHYKFNYFHWHLTEDQGWRIEIKKYPRLTEVGSIRKQTRAGRYADTYVGDGKPYGGFYTQDEVRDIVAYARARYITVIPEIEMPGHSVAALAAYPNLGCKADATYEVFTDWGITKDIYCPKEETFAFLEDVLTEVIGLFPDSPYIHIGGDEAPKDAWKASTFVQDLKAKEGLKDEHEVQSYFVRRMEKYINSKGKKIIGWDEILEGGLAPNATVMSWRGIKGGIEAAKAKHDVIMTPTDYCYLDYGQGDPSSEPINIGGYLPLEKVYSFEPVPKELSPDEAKYIIGGQGNIWTEYLATPADVEYMAFPRMMALSEVVWSSAESKDFADFSKRLSAHLPRLSSQNVNYRMPEPTGLKNMVVTGDQKVVVALDAPAENIGLYYAIGESKDWTTYNKPIEIDVKQGERVDLRVMESAGLKRSSVYTATILRRDYLKPVELAEKRPGVTYGFLIPAADPLAGPTLLSGESRSIGLQQFAKTADLKSNFGLTFDGYFNAPADAIYEFQVDSTWDTTILVGGEKIIDDTGTNDRKVRSAVIPLKAGLHKITLRYNHRGGDAVFRVRWAIKGQNWRNIGGGELVH